MSLDAHVHWPYYAWDRGYRHGEGAKEGGREGELGEGEKEF